MHILQWCGQPAAVVSHPLEQLLVVSLVLSQLLHLLAVAEEVHDGFRVGLEGG